MNNLENILAEETWLSDKCFTVLDVIHKNFYTKTKWLLAWYPGLAREVLALGVGKYFYGF